MPARRTHKEVVRPLNQGTFGILAFVGILYMLTSVAAVVAIVWITVNGRQPHAILGALAVAGRDDLLKLGDRVFRWTRGINDMEEEAR